MGGVMNEAEAVPHGEGLHVSNLRANVCADNRTTSSDPRDPSSKVPTASASFTISELYLRDRGVTFERRGGHVYPFGPSDKPELRHQLRLDVERRAALMVTILQNSPAVGYYRVPTSTMVIVDPPPPRVRAGICDCCGDKLEPHIGGWCALCTLAVIKAHERAR